MAKKKAIIPIGTKSFDFDDIAYAKKKKISYQKVQSMYSIHCIRNIIA